MHDLRSIRANPEEFDKGLKRRGIQPQLHQSKYILNLDSTHRGVQERLQVLQERKNSIARKIGYSKQQGLDITDLLKEGEENKQQIAGLEKDSRELHELLSSIPNLPAADCPDGTSEEDNVEKRCVGEIPKFSFNPKHHYELGEDLKFMDFERSAKLSGSRFVVLYDGLARLERALANFMVDIHTRDFGYLEVYPPLLVNDATMFGTGQLPKFREDQFQTNSGHWLIPTAEVVLTNLVAGEILSEAELPLRYVAYTPCFRLEAGAAGKDTRGMIRQHQFSKVELVSITTPEQSVAEHERMTAAAETVLKRLDLPYRVLELCTGDMGFSAEKTYDLEVWLPGQNAYREISSCSRCNTFQARRMNARYRAADGKPHFVHTLNGSGVAVGRALIAVIENYQQEDGSIAIPDALLPYMGGRTKIEKIK